MNEKLNIQNLIDLLAEKNRIAPKDAEDFVKAFFALIEEGLEQDRYVKIKGLGTFKLIGVESRGSVDVNTGERIEIQGHTKVSFTPDPTLKEIINRPFGHFETVILNENTVLEDTPVEKDGEEDTEEGVVALQNVGDDSVPVTDNLSAPEPVSVASEREEATVVAEAEEEDIRKEDAEPRAEEEKKAPLETEERQLSMGEKGKDSGMKWLWATLACVLLACAGVVCYLYFPDMQKSAPTLPTESRQSSSAESPVKELVQVSDSLGEKTDTIRRVSSEKTEIPVAEKDKAKVEMPQKAVKKTPVKKTQPVVPDSVNYEITGTMTTYTVKEGETLTRISLRFYGTKALWPYIVKHNMNVLKDPNNVTSGTVLRIPKLAEKQ